MKFHDITKDDMLNGEGLRVVLWVSGCAHACPGCHNEVTWNPNIGVDFDDVAVQEIFAELDKDYVSGITFSGGDPLFMSNREPVGKLIKQIKNKYPTKTIWLYTGYLWDEIKNLDFIPLVDVLIDGKFEQKLLDKNLHWVGSSNQRIIDVASTIKNKKISLYRD